MILSWALTEVVRHLFHAYRLVGIYFPALVYLRYTTFILLVALLEPSLSTRHFPDGSSGCMACGNQPIMFTWVFSSSGGHVIIHINLITILSYQLLSGLYVMYTYMLFHRQRVFRRICTGCCPQMRG